MCLHVLLLECMYSVCLQYNISFFVFDFVALSPLSVLIPECLAAGVHVYLFPTVAVRLNKFVSNITLQWLCPATYRPSSLVMRKILQSTYVLPVPSQWDFSEPVFPDKFFFPFPSDAFFLFFTGSLSYVGLVWSSTKHIVLFRHPAISRGKSKKTTIIIYTQRTSKKGLEFPTRCKY